MILNSGSGLTTVRCVETSLCLFPGTFKAVPWRGARRCTGSSGGGRPQGRDAREGPSFPPPSPPHGSPPLSLLQRPAFCHHAHLLLFFWEKVDNPAGAFEARDAVGGECLTVVLRFSRGSQFQAPNLESSLGRGGRKARGRCFGLISPGDFT